MMPRKQQGFSLFLVMILMLVIALLVIVTAQSSSTEMRMSSNEADRKFALSLAENGLREAENHIAEIMNNKTRTEFKADCENGYCLPADGTYSTESFAPFVFGTGTASVAAWERCAASPTSNQSAANNCQTATVIDTACTAAKRCLTSDDGNAHYIIEYLGSKSDTTDYSTHSYFRITSRAHGENEDTTVTLQSYVELTS